MVKKSNKSQISVEYMVILSLSLMLIIPLIGFVYSSTEESITDANTNMILTTGKKMISVSENVYYQGKGSKILLELNLPPEIKNITVLNNDKSKNIPSELVFNTRIDGKKTEFVFFSPVNITFNKMNPSYPCQNQKTSLGSNNMTGGINKFFVHSCGNNVSIYKYFG
ncbi:MAG: hypothetical protein ACQER9_04235 [Nanobdellota archaeon]